MTASREAEVGWWYVPSPANAPLDDCHGVWPWRGARYAQGDHDTHFALRALPLPFWAFLSVFFFCVSKLVCGS